MIGGGDWSNDRIIPDCVKSYSKKKNVIIRNPNSTRPWQHVLEVVYGYLTLDQNYIKIPIYMEKYLTLVLIKDQIIRLFFF